MTSQVFSLRLLLSEIFFLRMYNIQKYMCSVTSERVCVFLLLTAGRGPAAVT